MSPLRPSIPNLDNKGLKGVQGLKSKSDLVVTFGQSLGLESRSLT